MCFDSFIADIQKNEWNVFGVEVYEEGNLEHSYGDTTDSMDWLKSCT